MFEFLYVVLIVLFRNTIHHEKDETCPFLYLFSESFNTTYINAGASSPNLRLITSI